MNPDEGRRDFNVLNLSVQCEMRSYDSDEEWRELGYLLGPKLLQHHGCEIYYI
jgi:hypothetical protein